MKTDKEKVVVKTTPKRPHSNDIPMNTKELIGWLKGRFPHRIHHPNESLEMINRYMGCLETIQFIESHFKATLERHNK